MACRYEATVSPVVSAWSPRHCASQIARPHSPNRSTDTECTKAQAQRVAPSSSGDGDTSQPKKILRSFKRGQIGALEGGCVVTCTDDGLRSHRATVDKATPNGHAFAT